MQYGTAKNMGKPWIEHESAEPQSARSTIPLFTLSNVKYSNLHTLHNIRNVNNVKLITEYEPCEKFELEDVGLICLNQHGYSLRFRNELRLYWGIMHEISMEITHILCLAVNNLMFGYILHTVCKILCSSSFSPSSCFSSFFPVTICFDWCCVSHSNSLSTFLKRLNCFQSLWNRRFSNVSSLPLAFRKTRAIEVKKCRSSVASQCCALGKQAF